MSSDFNSCRFDFRLDSKNRLLPSRRRRASSAAVVSGGIAPMATTRDRAGLKGRRAATVGSCSTLYSCKICGRLLHTRADRNAHKLSHQKQLKQASRMTFGRDDVANSSRKLGLQMLGVTHPGFWSNNRFLSATTEPSTTGEPSSSEHTELERTDLEEFKSVGTMLTSAAVLQSGHDVTVCDAMPGPGITSSDDATLLDDVIVSRDCKDTTTGSACGKVSVTADESKHAGANPVDLSTQSDEVLDLTTKTTTDYKNLLPGLHRENFRTPTTDEASLRKKKSFGLHLTVQKLWESKLQQQQACGADDVRFYNLEISMSNDAGIDPTVTSGLVDRGHEAVSHTRLSERPIFELAAGKIRGSESAEGNGAEHPAAELKLRRVVAVPGEQRLFYTSLMSLQSVRRKPQRRQRTLTAHTADHVHLVPAASFQLQLEKGSWNFKCSSPTVRGTGQDHVTSITCRVCSFLALDADDLRSHVMATHGHEMEELRAVHWCTKCGRRFTSRGSLVHHVNSRHHTCVTSLRRHNNTHLSLRRRLQQQFSQVTACNEHAVEHQPRDPTMTSSGTNETGSYGDGSTCRVTCEYPGCRREFRELKHLKVHRMQHTNERPLSCALCTYSCRQRNSLNWHMQSRHGLSKSVTDDGRTVYVDRS